MYVFPNIECILVRNLSVWEIYFLLINFQLSTVWSNAVNIVHSRRACSNKKYVL